MTTNHAPPLSRPPAMLRGPIGVILIPLAYLGETALLAASAARALVRPRGAVPPLRVALTRQMDGMLGMGLPLVFLVHVPLGSFLAMQAYFHATFTEAVGAVVALGLLRNLAPIASGMTIAGLLAARIVPELRGSHVGLDGDPLTVPDRDVVRGQRPDERITPEPARLAAVRLLAAALSGPVLALVGMLVGSTIGLLVSRSMLHVAPAIFLGKFLVMLRPIDVIGLVFKGSAFALVSALFACEEGLRRGDEPGSTRVAACRAACLSAVGILMINGSWFTLAYLGSAPFGPDVVAP